VVHDFLNTVFDKSCLNLIICRSLGAMIEASYSEKLTRARMVNL
jgi:hypothetical protein